MILLRLSKTSSLWFLPEIVQDAVSNDEIVQDPLVYILPQEINNKLIFTIVNDFKELESVSVI